MFQFILLHRKTVPYAINSHVLIITKTHPCNTLQFFTAVKLEFSDDFFFYIFLIFAKT